HRRRKGRGGAGPQGRSRRAGLRGAGRESGLEEPTGARSCPPASRPWHGETIAPRDWSALSHASEGGTQKDLAIKRAAAVPLLRGGSVERVRHHPRQDRTFPEGTGAHTASDLSCPG